MVTKTVALYALREPNVIPLLSTIGLTHAFLWLIFKIIFWTTKHANEYCIIIHNLLKLRRPIKVSEATEVDSVPAVILRHYSVIRACGRSGISAEFPLAAQINFCDSRSPLRDLPLPLIRFLARSTPASMFQAANWKSGPIFIQRIGLYSLGHYGPVIGIREQNRPIGIRFPVYNLFLTSGKYIDFVEHYEIWKASPLSEIEEHIFNSLSPLLVKCACLHRLAQSLSPAANLTKSGLSEFWKCALQFERPNLVRSPVTAPYLLHDPRSWLRCIVFSSAYFPLRSRSLNSQAGTLHFPLRSRSAHVLSLLHCLTVPVARLWQRDRSIDTCFFFD